MSGRATHALIVAAGCSLGAGPGQCTLPSARHDAGAGSAPARPGSGAPPLATTPRRDERTTRENLASKPPPAGARFTFPEGVVVGAVRVLQPTFAACWKRAQRNDPSLVSARVRIYLEVDAAGAITSSRTDAEDPKLGGCLAGVARGLAFPAPGRAVALDIPMFF